MHGNATLDLADACLCVMRAYDDPQPINLGEGVARAIRELAASIKEVIDYEGALHFDTSKQTVCRYGMPL